MFYYSKINISAFPRQNLGFIGRFMIIIIYITGEYVCAAIRLHKLKQHHAIHIIYNKKKIQITKYISKK